jgi:hypothetical protein
LNENEIGFDSSYKKYLPTEIPAYASDVRFYKSLRAVIGRIQLRFKAPPEKIKDIIEQNKEHAIYIQKGTPLYVDNVRCMTRFRSYNNNNYFPLSEDFLVMVLRYGRGEKPIFPLKDWLYDYSAGIAVNEKTNEVVYWVTYPNY